MSGGNNSIVTKLTARIFPVMPDFYGMMVEQCDVTARGMDVFLEFMKTADTAKADQVRAIGQVAIMQFQAHSLVMWILINMVDPGGIKQRGTSFQTMYFIAFR